MKSYLDLVPISAKVHKRQNRMSVFCIVLAVFLVTAIFGMADMFIRSQIMQARMEGGNWHVAVKNINEEQAKIISVRPEVTASSWYGILNYREIRATSYRVKTWQFSEAIKRGLQKCKRVSSMREAFPKRPMRPW